MNVLGDLASAEGISILVSAFGLYQQNRLHKTELEKARERHEVALAVSQNLLSKSLTETKRYYLLELYNNLEQHFQQLNADLIASCKEAERDMFDQRNQSLQTIILSSSVMFGALSTAIVNGTLIDGSSSFIVWGFGICSALSFGALFLSIVLCIETVMRASLFMYRRAQLYTDLLRNAIDGTRKIMDGMRQHTEYESNAEKIRKISQMPEEELEKEFKNHEKIIREYLKHRENINTRAAMLRSGRRARNVQSIPRNGNGNGDDSGISSILRNRRGEHPGSPTGVSIKSNDSLFSGSSEEISVQMTFNEFWDEKCQWYASKAFGLFYFGTGTLLITIAFYLYSKFYYQYHTELFAWFSCIIVVVLFVFGSFLARHLRNETKVYNRKVFDEEKNRLTDGDVEEGDSESNRNDSRED
jgi:uncharacterized membrane protein